MARLSESLRRAYRELVRRRARVRVVAAAPQELGEPPIFLLGLYRSGTTLLRFVIDSHSRICCPPESEFISSLRPLVEDPRAIAGLDAMGFDSDHVTRRARELVAYFFGNYADSCGKPRWADKSPSYVDHLELLWRLFPDARYVVLLRHGLDQAHSFTRGGTLDRAELSQFVRQGEDPRLGAVRYWREKTERLLEFEAKHPESCHRLRYEDLCAAPESTLRQVFTFLGEPWEPETLDFHRFPHDRGFEDGRVVATGGFQASGGHYLEWSPDLRSEALKIAGPLLGDLGYESGEEPSA